MQRDVACNVHPLQPITCALVSLLFSPLLASPLLASRLSPLDPSPMSLLLILQPEAEHPWNNLLTPLNNLLLFFVPEAEHPWNAKSHRDPDSAQIRKRPRHIHVPQHHRSNRRKTHESVETIFVSCVPVLSPPSGGGETERHFKEIQGGEDDVCGAL